MKKYRNKVCSKLEKGNGSISGMKMLYPLENRCLIEVTVVGIDFDGWSRRGVTVEIRPVHGVGDLCVEAQELIDNTQKAKDLYFRKSKATHFAEDNKLSTNSDKNWRALVTRQRANLTTTERAKFDKLVEKRLVDKKIAKASEWELRQVWNDLITVKFRLDEDDKIADEY